MSDVTSVTQGGTPPGLGFLVPESKVHPPVARTGIVARTALIDRLDAAEAPVDDDRESDRQRDDRGRDDEIDDRVGEGLPEHRVLEQVLVVVQAREDRRPDETGIACGWIRSSPWRDLSGWRN